MKKKALLITMIMVGVLLVGCTQPKVGNLVITSDIEINEDKYGDYYYTGKVKNKGNNTVYNASINFTIYETAAKNTIIDTAWDYLADGENIKPGEGTYIETFTTDVVNNIEQMEYYNYEITWLER